MSSLDLIYPTVKTVLEVGKQGDSLEELFVIAFERSYDAGKTWERVYSDCEVAPVWDHLCAYERLCVSLPPDEKEKIRLRMVLENISRLTLPSFKPRL